eukprot:676171-Rhodomonas_salina.2
MAKRMRSSTAAMLPFMVTMLPFTVVALPLMVAALPFEKGRCWHLPLDGACHKLLHLPVAVRANHELLRRDDLVAAYAALVPGAT